MKNTLKGIGDALDTTEEKISEFEDTSIKTIQNETNRKKDTEVSIVLVSNEL